MRLIVSLILLGLFHSVPAFADEITHQLGNSGYAIREAMQNGANRKSPEHYWTALRLQNQAKRAFRAGAYQRAVELSKQAETEAKLAIEASR